MAVDRATFVADFPEFTEMAADSDAQLVIDRALRDAKRFCGQKQWGTRWQDGVFVKAAELLSMTPFGENMRMKDGKSPYTALFRSMQVSLPYRFAAPGID
jgi:hypothetical protein